MDTSLGYYEYHYVALLWCPYFESGLRRRVYGRRVHFRCSRIGPLYYVHVRHEYREMDWLPDYLRDLF